MTIDRRFLFYRAVRALLRGPARVLFRLAVDGVEHVPGRTAGVLVAAHRSWLDPPSLGAACPRPVRFMILDTVYEKRWARWFYRRMRSIPVRPEQRGSAMALREAIRHLRRGGLIGVFPEGRVVGAGEVPTLHTGAALLAARSGAPLIPIRIEGTAVAWPHRGWPRAAPVRVRFGAPVQAPSSTDRELLQRTMEQLWPEIAPEQDP